jgi:hypothetical protein
MNLKKQYFAEMFRNDYYTIEVTFDSSNPGVAELQQALHLQGAQDH